MNKELEHLEILEDWANEHHNSKEVWKHSIPVQEALQRLEAIDNANSSEALNQIDFMILDCITTPLQQEALETVKQALLKAQEQEKVKRLL